MPHHPLCLEALTDESGWEDYGFYSKGHHPAPDFLALVAEEIDGTDEARFRHDWWRYQPNATGGGRYVDAEPHRHGAFPVTIYWDINA